MVIPFSFKFTSPALASASSISKSSKFLTLSRMDIFEAAPIFDICHRYHTMMKLGTVIPYLKKTQKIYESRDTPPELCWHQHFFTGNQQILLYQKIQILIVFWYIISNSFNFSWVFKHFCNKPGYNFGDASKSGYPRPS